MKKVLSILLGLSLAVAVAGCGSKQSAKPAAGEQAKPITVYTALEDDQIQRFLKSFKEKHPEIKVNVVRDSTGIITARLLAEKDNPQADVVWGVAATSLLVLDQKGMLEGYAPAGVDRVFPEFKGSGANPTWVGIDVTMSGVVVNTKEIAAKNLPIPSGYDDLINPAYKGLITMPNPSSSGTGYLTVWGFIQHFGAEKAWEYMDKLNENMAIYTLSGSKPAKMTAQGEYPLGITFGYRGIVEKKKGAPLDVVFLKEGAGWDVEANALMKKPDIKKEAKVFLDWAISDDVMKEYFGDVGFLTVKNSYQVPEGFPADPMKAILKTDINEAAKQRDSVLQQWEQRYGSKNEPKK